MASEKKSPTGTKLALVLSASWIGFFTGYCHAIVIVNDTKSNKYVELSTFVDDHLWMRKHNIYTGAPAKKILLFRTTVGPRNIVKTVPFLLNNLTIQVSWGKKNKNRYEQHFTLAESQTLESDPLPHKFTRYHVIRLVDVPNIGTLPQARPYAPEELAQIRTELLYIPHGKHYVRDLLGERRALEKHR
jgi:hypothetical protein